MEETKNLELGSGQEQEEKSAIDFQLIYSTLILNWKWFVLSLIVCLGMGYLYLRYAKPQYQATAKLLIKDDDQNKSRGMGNSMIQNAANLGFISNSKLRKTATSIWLQVHTIFLLMHSHFRRSL